MTLSRKDPNNLINLLVLIVLMLAFLITASKTGLLNSGFRYLIDDHQIPLMHHDLITKGFFKTIYTWINYDRNIVHRFRPYYQIHIVTLTQIFGLNSFLWFLYISIIGSLTTFFLFLFGRLLNFSVLIALLFSISTLLGSQSEIWVRPIIPDSQGMFLLSIALVFLGLSCKHKNHSSLNNISFVIFTILMSLCKESYIIFISTLIFLKTWLYSHYRQVSFWQAIKQNKFLLISLVSIFALEIFYIIFYLGTGGTGYAGVDQSSFQIASVLSTANIFLNESFFTITFISIILSLILSKLNHDSILTPLKEFIPFFILLLISVIPHIILYSKSGISAGFYLFPSILVTSLFLAKTLSFLGHYSKGLSLLLITVLCILLVNRLPLVWNIYSQQANDSKSINNLLEQVELCTSDNQAILVVLNPRVRYEAADALQRVLRNTVNRNNLLIATYGLDQSQFYSEKLAESEKNWKFLEPKAVANMYQNRTLLNNHNKNGIKAVIIFDGLDDDFIETNKSWFFPDNFQLMKFKISFAPANLYCKH